MRSVDILVEEVAVAFDGEDPLRPIMRRAMEATHERLMALHHVLGTLEPLELKEPDEETMELARTYFENGKELMERL